MDETLRLLRATAHGDREAYDELFGHVYATLRRMAGARMKAERCDHTLTPTALVHEAYVKMLAGDRSGWENREQFYAIAARAMRQLLVDHAVKRKTEKRGGGRVRVTLGEDAQVSDAPIHDVLVLEQALVDLERENERCARVVVCRFYGGLDVQETARALGTSPSTVKRDWAYASAWLNRALSREESDH